MTNGKKPLRWLVALVTLSLAAVPSLRAEELRCSSFDGYLSGEITEKLIVDVDCILDEANIRGNVEVRSPSYLTILKSELRGNVECQSREHVTVQGSRVYGNFSNCAVNRSNGQMPKGRKRIGSLYLFQKLETPGGPWPILDGGAWGVLDYSLWGETFNFRFHGRNLVPGVGYTLIYYPDPWPGNGLICLASGVANRGGNLHLWDHDFEIGTNLPAPHDANYSPLHPSGAVGAKIWLVPSEDVDCEGPIGGEPSMTAWRPSRILFEYNLINFEHRPD